MQEGKKGGAKKRLVELSSSEVLSEALHQVADMVNSGAHDTKGMQVRATVTNVPRKKK